MIEKEIRRKIGGGNDNISAYLQYLMYTNTGKYNIFHKMSLTYLMYKTATVRVDTLYI
jgi:hypothetical protein